MNKGTPTVTEMQVIPVAGYDSMLMTLSGCHAPYFTRNLVILKDSAGHTGIGEIHGGDYTCEALKSCIPLVVGQQVGKYRAILDSIHKASKRAKEDDGEGIQSLATADIDDYDVLYDRLVKGGQLLIEEPIRQHPDMNKLCPDSVNTVRIVTLVTAQGAQMVYALVRMGMGGVCVDNVSSGGMYAPVNEHGQLYRPAFCDKTGKYYERHPVTGTEITGFQIPLFDQALELCRTASRRVEAHLKYIGWDVAITPDGPVLVEGNNLPGYDMCQNAGHVDEGMLPRFEKLLGRPIM